MNISGTVRYIRLLRKNVVFEYDNYRLFPDIKWNNQGASMLLYIWLKDGEVSISTLADVAFYERFPKKNQKSLETYTSEYLYHHTLPLAKEYAIPLSIKDRQVTSLASLDLKDVKKFFLNKEYKKVIEILNEDKLLLWAYDTFKYEFINELILEQRSILYTIRAKSLSELNKETKGNTDYFHNGIYFELNKLKRLIIKGDAVIRDYLKYILILDKYNLPDKEVSFVEERYLEDLETRRSDPELDQKIIKYFSEVQTVLQKKTEAIQPLANFDKELDDEDSPLF